MKKDFKTIETSVVIVGAGAAGLFAALTLAPRNVIVLSEKTLEGACASAWAQGGLAAAVGKGDSALSHTADTLKAGAGTTDKDVAHMITSEAPKYVEILNKYGVRFERDADGHYALSREACHSTRRVLKAKAGDGFGAEMMRALTEAARKTPSITVIENVSAEKILRRDGVATGAVQGIQIRSNVTGETTLVIAPAVLMATGGAGGLFAATTNPLHALGRGVALAARAGAVLSDLEFVQFHPTALDIGEDPAPLATEALRGEGAYLVNSRGERFMKDWHPMAELAPRDEVSRGSFAQIHKGQRVYLDCRHIDVSHFPALISAAARAGLNPQRDLIPVMPAVHYHMGGIATDLNGRSSIQGLWAAGECAATGLHGANRLASNSLLEAVVMGARAAKDILEFVKNNKTKPAYTLPITERANTMEMTAKRGLLRNIMTDLVGVIRTEKEMKQALRQLDALYEEAEGKDARTADMALMARMITISALLRQESRGGHCRSDYPTQVKTLQKRSFVTLKQLNAAVAETLATVKRDEHVA